jgi:hypothetical protein
MEYPDNKYVNDSVSYFAVVPVDGSLSKTKLFLFVMVCFPTTSVKHDDKTKSSEFSVAFFASITFGTASHGV